MILRLVCAILGHRFPRILDPLVVWDEMFYHYKLIQKCRRCGKAERAI